MSDTQVQIKKSPAGHYVLRRKNSGNATSEPLAAAYDRAVLVRIAERNDWDIVQKWS